MPSLAHQYCRLRSLVYPQEDILLHLLPPFPHHPASKHPVLLVFLVLPALKLSERVTRRLSRQVPRLS